MRRSHKKIEAGQESTTGRHLAEPASAPQSDVPVTPASALTSSGDEGPDIDQSREEPLSMPSETLSAEYAKERSGGFERQFGGRAFVWIGAVALALAGFFLVKYSIEAGLLSPTVRVTMGIVFGIGLLYTGNRVRVKPGFANGLRIAQALSGAGIAVLYASSYAATSIYDLIPAWAGFTGLAIVTAAAVALSTWHGRPIALLGLMGGFLTPALVRSPHPMASILFIYLFLVLTGLMVVIRYRGWWSMGLPAVLGAFLWVPIWLYSGHFQPADTLWLGLFLLASAATAVIASKQQYEKDGPGTLDRQTAASALNYLTFCSATVLMGITAFHGGFGVVGWCLFGLLSAGRYCSGTLGREAVRSRAVDNDDRKCSHVGGLAIRHRPGICFCPWNFCNSSRGRRLFPAIAKPGFFGLGGTNRRSKPGLLPHRLLQDPFQSALYGYSDALGHSCPDACRNRDFCADASCGKRAGS